MGVEEEFSLLGEELLGSRKEGRRVSDLYTTLPAALLHPYKPCVLQAVCARLVYSARSCKRSRLEPSECCHYISSRARITRLLSSLDAIEEGSPLSSLSVILDSRYELFEKDCPVG